MAESVHEIVPKSLGGKVSLENSIPVCGDGVRGCHGLLQRHEVIVQSCAGEIRKDYPNDRPLLFEAKTKAARRWLDLPGDWMIRP
jgi:hypothetical protein